MVQIGVYDVAAIVEVVLFVRHSGLIYLTRNWLFAELREWKVDHR